MKKITLSFVIFVILAILARPAAAQEQSELKLRMSRDFGYSNGMGDVQGTFTLKASGPNNLARVVFMIDGQTMGEVTQAPFNLSFNTSSYSNGMHSLLAAGTTTDGLELRSNEIRANFVSAEEGWQSGMKIVVPLLAIILGITVLGMGSMLFTSKKLLDLPPGTPRKYGASGGTICPRCKRPYALHLISLNMVTGKLEHCPFCGKWAVVRTKSMDELRAAEAAELQDAQKGELSVEESAEDKLRKELEDSRFQD
jgi:hypothetical protein